MYTSTADDITVTRGSRRIISWYDTFAELKIIKTGVWRLSIKF